MLKRMKNIVLGVAHTREDDPHLAPALELAAETGATLHLVHAFPLPEPLLAPHIDLLNFSPDAVEKMKDAYSERLIDQTAKRRSEAAHEIHAVPGPPGVSILEVAERVEADLILVGATRRGGFARTVLGTTAQRVVRGAQAPVLLVRNEKIGAPSRVLIGTDLSQHSERVHRRAYDILQMLSAGDETVVHSVLVIDFEMPFPPPLEPGAVREVADRQLGSFLDRAGSRRWTNTRVVRVGEPAREIVREAEEWNADLLVVGTHSRRGPSRFLIGSVAEGVLKKSKCNTLVIPPAALPDGDGGRADAPAEPEAA